MAVLNRTITTIAGTALTTVVAAPTSPAIRGILTLYIHNPIGNSTLTATLSVHNGTTNYPINSYSIAAAATAVVSDRLLLTSIDTLRVTLSASPTTPVNVMVTYNDGQ